LAAIVTKARGWFASPASPLTPPPPTAISPGLHDTLAVKFAPAATLTPVLPVSSIRVTTPAAAGAPTAPCAPGAPVAPVAPRAPWAPGALLRVIAVSLFRHLPERMRRSAPLLFFTQPRIFPPVPTNPPVAAYDVPPSARNRASSAT